MSKNTITVFGYLFVQSALLFLHYGMKYTMPWWVTWFPSVLTSGVLVLIGSVLLIIGVVGIIAHLLGKMV